MILVIVTVLKHFILQWFYAINVKTSPVSILYKSIAGPYRPVRVAEGPITALSARYRFIKNASWVVFDRSATLFSLTLRKHAYSNTLKILPPKIAIIQIKNSDIFHISAQKHRLWVLVRTASSRRF